MKALILAAGYGTRLLPYTQTIPKPLFTLNSMPVLGHVIQKLAGIGCSHIFINTHHLHEQVKAFAEQFRDTIPVSTIYEPTILDTGGAIANAKDFLCDAPFFVINSDIIFSTDLSHLYNCHQKSGCLATLVLHDYKKFNKIKIDSSGYIRSFDAFENTSLAFTGIQVLSPEIFNYFPSEKIFSSIDVYKKLAPEKKIKAYVPKNIYWSDIGTKQSYAMTSLLELAAPAFNLKRDKIKHIKVQKLAGDGSDRQWYRAAYNKQTAGKERQDNKNSYIIGDHGICLPNTEAEDQLNAFVQIGRHLFSKKIPVPEILNYDSLSGMVLMEDLGDVHLADYIKTLQPPAITKLYKKVIDELIRFSSLGIKDFDTAWTCQTETYSKELILEKECRYFMDAFVNNYLKQDTAFKSFKNEFAYIADQALKNGISGLMHRDFQSKNIMIKNKQIFFIDFQSARIGPLQYDLASLLIDPYTGLRKEMQNELLEYTIKSLHIDTAKACEFKRCYLFCCLTRNLQMLGAFSFLSQARQKKHFEQYIAPALQSLKNIINELDSDKISGLAEFIQFIESEKQ